MARKANIYICRKKWILTNLTLQNFCTVIFEVSFFAVNPVFAYLKYGHWTVKTIYLLFRLWIRIYNHEFINELFTHYQDTRITKLEFYTSNQFLFHNKVVTTRKMGRLTSVNYFLEFSYFKKNCCCNIWTLDRIDARFPVMLIL